KDAVVAAIAPGEVATDRFEGVDGRAGHAERLQQRAADEALIGLAGQVGDRAAEQRVAEIAVLEGKTRRPREQRAGLDQRIEPRRAHAQHAVAPWIAGDGAAPADPHGALSRVAGATSANRG